MMSLFTERCVTALMMFLIACGLHYSSFDANYADLGGAFDPTFFPRIILMVWLGLAFVIMLIEGMRRTQSKPFKIMRVLSLVFISFAYVLLLKEYGFFLTSVAFCVLALLSLGVRQFFAIVLFSLLVPGSLVLLFNHILTLPLPTSPFTFLF